MSGSILSGGTAYPHPLHRAVRTRRLATGTIGLRGLVSRSLLALNVPADEDRCFAR